MSADQVLLWRHGRTSHNLQSRFQGHLDVPLDEVGLRQVEAASHELARIAGAAPPVRIVSSDLARAADSARVLGRRLDVPVELDAGLREVSAGAWEGLTRDQIIEHWPEDYAAWRRGDDVRVGGAETRGEAAARAAKVIDRIDAEVDGGTIVAASHGGALRGAILLLLGMEGGAWHVLEVLRNAHWAQLRRRPYGWVLGAYNVGVDAGLDVPPDAAARGHGHAHRPIGVAQPE